MKLDDLYKMTAFIYQDANLARSREATFLHFVEVCGMLTLVARKKLRERVDVPGALCKALGWYFPLVAKMGVGSIEQVIFAKYPYACPYCREAPHNERECKLVKGVEATVSHEDLTELSAKNQRLIPTSLNGWQRMFNDIYPRNLSFGSFSVVALLEELGELAEAIRVFDRYPHYFFGEVADAFSYIMGIANEYSLENDFDFEAEFISRYPGLCVNCGSRICVCPPVPPATIGRMAKELHVDLRTYAIRDIKQFADEGEKVAFEVFESSGANNGIANHLPYDRGELNAAMMQLCYRLANAVGTGDEALASSLRNSAFQLGSARADRGSIERTGEPDDLLASVRQAWSSLDENAQNEIRENSNEPFELTSWLEERILIVTSNPRGQSDTAIRLDSEVREIREAFRRSHSNKKADIKHLTAATIDDFRRDLMENQYDFIHFAGHAGKNGLSFMRGADDTDSLEYDALQPLLKSQKRLRCLILNACSSLDALIDPIGVQVIGMISDIDDEASVEFSKGFYDAVAVGKTSDEAFEEGVLSLKAKSHDTHVVAKLAAH